MKNILGWVVATILGFMLLQKSCNNKEVSMEVIKTKIDTMYVARPTQTKYITKLVPVTKYYTDTIINNVDTSHVINEFYATSEYIDTIRFDKATVAIKERVTQNMIIARMASIDIMDQFITKTVFIAPKVKPTFAVGSSVLFNSKQVSLSVDGLYIPKYSNTMFFGGYDVIQQKVRVGAYFRLNRKSEFEPVL
jgi:hypothetical protein